MCVYERDSIILVCVFMHIWLLIEEYNAENEKKKEGESDQCDAIIITCD